MTDRPGVDWLRRLRRAARRDWPSLAVLGVASLVAGFGWHWTTRPMGDSSSYRSAARSIAGGWHHLTDRTPGYPLLLWLAGSTHGETHLLFVVQLALHLATVMLVIRVAHRLGVPDVGRAAIAVLLVMPPEMVLVVHSGSEALSQFLVAAATWALMSWYVRRRRSRLVVAGVMLGGLAWVTPAMALLCVPLAVIAALCCDRRQRVAALSSVAAPALVIVASLLLINAVRFDAPELTPLTGWYLGSRTSLYVQRLSGSYEPARSILVTERNRELLEGELVDAPNYSFAVRRQLQRRLHMTSRQADHYMLSLNLHLIVHHPINYLSAVTQAVPRYVDVDSEPDVLVAGHASGWAMELVHLLLAAVSAGVAAIVVGLAWTRRLHGPTAAAWAFGAVIVGYGLATATMLETGTVRLRVPFDPILVLLLVSGTYTAVAARRSARIDPATDDST